MIKKPRIVMLVNNPGSADNRVVRANRVSANVNKVNFLGLRDRDRKKFLSLKLFRPYHFKLQTVNLSVLSKTVMLACLLSKTFALAITILYLIKFLKVLTHLFP